MFYLQNCCWPSIFWTMLWQYIVIWILACYYLGIWFSDCKKHLRRAERSVDDLTLIWLTPVLASYSLVIFNIFVICTLQGGFYFCPICYILKEMYSFTSAHMIWTKWKIFFLLFSWTIAFRFSYLLVHPFHEPNCLILLFVQHVGYASLSPCQYACLSCLF